MVELDGEDTRALSADELAKLLIERADNRDRVIKVSGRQVDVEFRPSSQAASKYLAAPGPFRGAYYDDRKEDSKEEEMGEASARVIVG